METQIETTMQYHYSLSKWLQNKHTNKKQVVTPNASKYAVKLDHSLTAGGNEINGYSHSKNSFVVCSKSNDTLSIIYEMVGWHH